MSSSTMTSGLVSTWVSTVDSRGRTRLEARWVDAGVPAAATPAAASLAAPAARPLVSHAGHAA